MVRRISLSRSLAAVTSDGYTTCELDSHADTCTIGKFGRLVQDTGARTSVGGFSDSFEAIKNVKIGTVALAYDEPETLDIYILFFHQALYIPTMENNLLCGDQMRNKGIIVNDTPLIRLKPEDRKPTSHCIIDEESGLRLPLKRRKPFSYFLCRKPTLEECTSQTNAIHVHMTSDVWELEEDDGDVEQRLRENVEVTNVADVGERRIQALAQCSPALTPDLFARRALSAIQSKARKGTVTAEQLARRWRCGVDIARRTIEKTTQRAVRDFTHSTAGRSIKPTNYQLRYPRIRADMYTDTMHGPCVSAEGNKYLAIYCTKFQWCRGFPLKKKGDSHLTLNRLFRDVGFPTTMIPDNAKELTMGDFKKICEKAQVTLHPIEAYKPNQNAAEDCIRELRRMFRRIMIARNIPAVFWDRVVVWCAEVRSHLALNHFELDGEVPTTVIRGDTADISYLVEFSIWDWVWYITPGELGTGTKRLGRWLGPSFDVGDALCYAVLTDTVNVVHRTSVFPLSVEDRNNESIKEMKKTFTEKMNRKLGDKQATLQDLTEKGQITVMEDVPSIVEEIPEYDKYEDEYEGDGKTVKHGPIIAPDAEDEEAIEFNRYLAAKVQFADGNAVRYGTVVGRKRDSDGNVIGTSHDNPRLDTTEYMIEFEDGRVEPFYANAIVEAIYARVDDEGHTMHELEEIIDHKRDASAILPEESFVTLRGKKIPKKTTRGWKMGILWKNGETTWEKMSDIKESYPIKLAEYAVANKIAEEPAFRWWVPYTLKKRDRILAAVKRRIYGKRYKNEKFGLEIPKTLRRALEIDRETGTNFWRKALEKEMKNILPVFEILEEGQKVPVGSTKIDLTVIFDIKMDFTRKVRICARGDMTDPPSSMTYASVVSRDSIRIGLLIASLNDLELMSADVAGAYLNADCPERVHIVCGPEFGEHEGKTAIIKKALYGLRSSGFAWRTLCARTLRESLGFRPCRADSDVWMRPAVKADGTKYYEYVFVYTDDIMVISTNPRAILDKLNTHFLLKPDSIGAPSIYLGAQILRYEIPGDPKAKWAMSSESYVKEAVRLVEKWLQRRNLSLKSKAPSVLPTKYLPELEGTEELNDEEATYYQSLIGILRWAVELGRIDIACEVSIMSSYTAMPRKGHLEAVFHIFAYLKHHSRSKIVMDDTMICHGKEEDHDWSEFYSFAKDELPPDMPEARGNPVDIVMFVDASHASNVVTRQSRTGVLIYVNRSPIMWYSKKQNSIETSSFGSEFTALKTGIEMLEGLRYKLRMMGIPLLGHAHVKVDNNAVVLNTSDPTSTLKKKSNSIAYHYVRSKVAAGIARISYENTKTNLADMLTKIQGGTVRKTLVRMVLF